MTILHLYFEGCCHGKLDAIYNEVLKQSRNNSSPIDLLLIGGDFQALRNMADLECIAIPPKYKQAAVDGDFVKYFTGSKVAPILTIFVGGNHEASNYLQELYYGGWVAPNIYYLGKSGAVVYKDMLRIAGLSGIYNKRDYTEPYSEKVPFESDTLRSVYHVRNYEVAKLEMLGCSLGMVDSEYQKNNDKIPSTLFKSMSVKELLGGNSSIQTSDSESQFYAPPIDIFMSHDWPVGIEQFGNKARLLKNKPFFKQDIQNGELGSPANMRLLKHLKPKNWLSAHLHVGFNAEVDHEKLEIKQKQDLKMEKVENEDEIELDLELNIDEDAPIKENDSLDNHIRVEEKDENKLVFPKSTSFVALDRCLPNRKFVHYLPIESNVSASSSPNKPKGSKSDNTSKTGKKKRTRSPSFSSPERLMVDSETDQSLLKYDPEWLSIVKTMNAYFPIKYAQSTSKTDETNDSEHINPSVCDTADNVDNNTKQSDESLNINKDDKPKNLPVDSNGDLITTCLTTPQNGAELSTLDENRRWVQDNVVAKDLLTIPPYSYYFGNVASNSASSSVDTGNGSSKKQKACTNNIESGLNKPIDQDSQLSTDVNIPNALDNSSVSSTEVSQQFSDPNSEKLQNADKIAIIDNPQTVRFCNILKIENMVKVLGEAELEKSRYKNQGQFRNGHRGHKTTSSGHNSRGFHHNNRGRGSNRGNGRGTCNNQGRGGYINHFNNSSYNNRMNSWNTNEPQSSFRHRNQTQHREAGSRTQIQSLPQISPDLPGKPSTDNKSSQTQTSFSSTSKQTPFLDSGIPQWVDSDSD